MSRMDCISNRTINIIASYVKLRLGHCNHLFQGLPYPSNRYACPDDFFLDEDEWTTYDNFMKILRKAAEMTGEPYFYFHCGASSARLGSWGRMKYFARVFSSPNDGFKGLPFFNKQFDDTKEIEVVLPPALDRHSGKYRTLLKIELHPDMDVHKDYIGDPLTRGILSSIPTLWGLHSATVRQPLMPYDPEILFNDEPEFRGYCLAPQMEANLLTLRHPETGRRQQVGKKVFLISDQVNGHRIFLGKYTEDPDKGHSTARDFREALMITETIRVGGRIIIRAGEIFKAPYAILDITYDRLSLRKRISQIFRFNQNDEETQKGMMETIIRLRETIESRNEAYHSLQKANEELVDAKKRVDDYARNLEQKVEERTSELRQAQERLLVFNKDLEARVHQQVQKLKRYDELRRYFSPKLTEQILSEGTSIGSEPKRKMMTVVFSDIRDFSATTESIEPEEIFHLLNRYLSEMISLIHAYDGTLNKIIGDGLLIFFGDPVPISDHAQKAVMMAVEMQKKIGVLRDEWLHYGRELGVGIGINTGYMTVGNIGSDMHKDYTVIGNQVNVSARLCSLAHSGQTLISQRTYSRVKHMVNAEEVGQILVKGIQHAVVTYSVAPSPREAAA